MLRGMPRPAIDFDTAPFWEACAHGRFTFQRCATCAAPRWPPGPMCPACQSEEATWVEASGEGQLYSWTVVVHPVGEALRDQVPYIVALIDLPEGLRVLANVIDCAPARLTAGMRLKLVFEDQEGLAIPNFRPA